MAVHRFPCSLTAIMMYEHIPWIHEHVGHDVIQLTEGYVDIGHPAAS